MSRYVLNNFTTHRSIRVQVWHVMGNLIRLQVPVLQSTFIVLPWFAVKPKKLSVLIFFNNYLFAPRRCMFIKRAQSEIFSCVKENTIQYKALDEWVSIVPKVQSLSSFLGGIGSACLMFTPTSSVAYSFIFASKVFRNLRKRKPFSSKKLTSVYCVCSICIA